MTGRPLDGKIAIPTMIEQGDGGAIVSDQARYITGIALPVDAGFVNKR